MKNNEIVKKLVASLVFFGGIVCAPATFAAHVCHTPGPGSFMEEDHSGNRFVVWGVSGITIHNCLWISKEDPKGRAFADSTRIILWRAQEKGLTVHIRYGDTDGSIWSVSDPMTIALCLQQAP